MVRDSCYTCDAIRYVNNQTKLLFQMGEGNAAIQSGGGLPVVGVGTV